MEHDQPVVEADEETPAQTAARLILMIEGKGKQGEAVRNEVNARPWPARADDLHKLTQALIDIPKGSIGLWVILVAPLAGETQKDKALRLAAVMRACRQRARLPARAKLDDLNILLASLDDADQVMAMPDWLLLAREQLDAKRLEAQVLALLKPLKGAARLSAGAACLRFGRPQNGPRGSGKFIGAPGQPSDVVAAAVAARCDDLATLGWLADGLHPDDLDTPAGQASVTKFFFHLYQLFAQAVRGADRVMLALMQGAARTFLCQWLVGTGQGLDWLRMCARIPGFMRALTFTAIGSAIEKDLLYAISYSRADASNLWPDVARGLADCGYSDLTTWKRLLRGSAKVGDVGALVQVLRVRLKMLDLSRVAPDDLPESLANPQDSLDALQALYARQVPTLWTLLGLKLAEPPDCADLAVCTIVLLPRQGAMKPSEKFAYQTCQRVLGDKVSVEAVDMVLDAMEQSLEDAEASGEVLELDDQLCLHFLKSEYDLVLLADRPCLMSALLRKAFAPDARLRFDKVASACVALLACNVPLHRLDERTVSSRRFLSWLGPDSDPLQLAATACAFPDRMAHGLSAALQELTRSRRSRRLLAYWISTALRRIFSAKRSDADRHLLYPALSSMVCHGQFAFDTIEAVARGRARLKAALPPCVIDGLQLAPPRVWSRTPAIEKLLSAWMQAWCEVLQTISDPIDSGRSPTKSITTSMLRSLLAALTGTPAAQRATPVELLAASVIAPTELPPISRTALRRWFVAQRGALQFAPTLAGCIDRLTKVMRDLARPAKDRKPGEQPSAFENACARFEPLHQQVLQWMSCPGSAQNLAHYSRFTIDLPAKDQPELLRLVPNLMPGGRADRIDEILENAAGACLLCLARDADTQEIIASSWWRHADTPQGPVLVCRSFEILDDIKLVTTLDAQDGDCSTTIASAMVDTLREVAAPTGATRLLVSCDAMAPPWGVPPARTCVFTCQTLWADHAVPEAASKQYFWETDIAQPRGSKH